MKRVVATMTLFLLLGAIVNVAVAWGCAIWSKQAEVQWSDASFRSRLVECYGIVPLKTDGFSGRQLEGFGTRYVQATLTRPATASGMPETMTINRYEHGWPLPCVWGEHRFGDGISDCGLHSLIFVRLDWSGFQRMFAYRPLGAGFVIDSAMYTVALWLVFGAPGSIRRWRRARRGLCQKCA